MLMQPRPMDETSSGPRRRRFMGILRAWRFRPRRAERLKARGALLCLNHDAVVKGRRTARDTRSGRLRQDRAATSQECDRPSTETAPFDMLLSSRAIPREADVTTIGFIGIGVMGAPMARNLLKGGYQLRVYDIDAAAMESLKQS